MSAELVRLQSVRAAEAVRAIRAAIANPASAGKRQVGHLYFGGGKGDWIVTWPNLPGLVLFARRRSYTHQLLPGWEYNVREMRTEMLGDLDRLAQTGELPKEATR